jgi:hypothetical protein
MKTLLMHRDRNFDWQRELPGHAGNLIQDLGLQVLFKVMAGGDEFLLQVVQRGVLWSLTEPEAIVYRQQALSDCLDNPAIVRAIYDLTVETLVEKKKIFGWFSQTPEQNLRYAVQVMQLLVRMLKRLRHIALESDTQFHSPAFKQFFAMLFEELDDEYFAVINEHLGRLQFRRGVLMSAGLGKGNAAADIVLRRRPTEKPRWSELIFGPREGRLWFDVHPRDDGGHQALSELQARGVNLVANALTQSTEHVLGFFVQLRAETAFYLGCQNLWAALNGRGLPTSVPQPKPVSEPSLSARGLYDASLALVSSGDVVSNDLAADGKGLVVITGANQGGKSTFLRSVGLAQLLMQAGMFAPATEFAANVASGVFTHFKREEDETMTRGKLDEELSRMSRIVDQIQPLGVLLCNESFASTNEREGSEIGQLVIGALNEAGVKVLLVTHLFDLSLRFRRDAPDGVLFLRAQRLSDGTRTFKIREGEALPTSHGKDLYEEIFRDDSSASSASD